MRLICLSLLLLLKAFAQAEDPIERSKALTADGAAEIEKSLAANPQDIAARLTLMWYYAGHNSVESHLSQLRHIEWMIENHPDSELFQKIDAKLQPFFLGAPFKAELDHAEELWSRAAAASHDDPKVLDNAQNSLYWVDPAASVRYMMRLRRAEPTNPRWVTGLLLVYSRLTSENPRLAKSLVETDLEPSHDLAVTGCVGQLLFGLGHAIAPLPDPYDFGALGEKLIRQAQSQDPTSWRWERTISVLTGMVKFGPAFNSAGRAAYFTRWIQNSLREEDLWPGGKVPELPLPGGALRDNSADRTAPTPILIHGLIPKADTSVRVEVLIGVDGRVKRAQYVAGMAMVAEECVRAALQWKFPPRMEKGRAVEVVAHIGASVTRAPPAAMAKPSPGIPGGFGTTMGGVLGGIIGDFDAPPPFVDPALIAPHLVRRVEPVYPTAAGNFGVKGTVRFRATLGPDGAVTSLELVSGPPMLVDAARTAVAQWLYSPWMPDGKQAAASTTIDVEVK